MGEKHSYPAGLPKGWAWCHGSPWRGMTEFLRHNVWIRTQKGFFFFSSLHLICPCCSLLMCFLPGLTFHSSRDSITGTAVGTELQPRKGVVAMRPRWHSSPWWWIRTGGQKEQRSKSCNWNFEDGSGYGDLLGRNELAPSCTVHCTIVHW